MAITEHQLHLILPNAGHQARVFIPHLNAVMSNREINTPMRQAAFLAQLGHESGHLRHVRELGDHAYLKKYDTGRLAIQLGNTPVADGDGQRYRGRGLIQVTGRSNYLRCSQALFGDQRLLSTPELLELPEWAAESAGWYWAVHGLNALADQNDFEAITRTINGGLNGLADRLVIHQRARAVLCV